MAAFSGQLIAKSTTSLFFADVPGPWAGADYKTVAMTSIALTPGGAPIAFVFMTHGKIDFDGASNTYGPPGLCPLASLKDAGRWAPSGYYGIMAVHPEARIHPDKPYDSQKNPRVKDHFQLTLDDRFPDLLGQLPVVQKAGDTNPGYYVSATRGGKAGVSRFKQSRYIDSNQVEFGALSCRLQSKGVEMGNCGMAIRLDDGNQSGFKFLKAGDQEGADEAAQAGEYSRPKKFKQTLEGAVGECSYKVFLNLGGKVKTPAQRQADNNFPTIFMVFPGSSDAPFAKLSAASNADDLPLLMAFHAEANQAAKGASGKPLLEAYLAKGKEDPKPKTYANILKGLKAAGYTSQS